MIYYFAYGSNLHPLRLRQRAPSAKLVGTAVLHAHHLRFHKKGQDGSGKCNLLHSGNEADFVHGAIYTLSNKDKRALDVFESRGSGYEDHTVRVTHHNRELDCIAYVAQPEYIADDLQPFHWYKQLVVLGAKHLRFPDLYVSSIEAVNSIDDPDGQRDKEHGQLIQSIVDSHPRIAQSWQNR